MTRVRELAPEEVEGLGLALPPRVREISPDELQRYGVEAPRAAPPRFPGGRDLPGVGDWMADAIQPPGERQGPPDILSTPLDMGLPAAEGWHERGWGERALGRGYEQLRGGMEGMAAAARAQNITDVDKWLRLTEEMKRPGIQPRDYMRLSTARRMLEQDIRTAHPGDYDLNDPQARAVLQERLAIRALQNIQSVAGREKTIQTEYPREPETEAALNRKGEPFGTALQRFGNIFSDSPLKIMGEIGLESALPSVAAITSGILTKSPAFAAAMMGNLSGAQEYGQGLFEVMRDAKVDTSKPENVLAALRDPVKGAEIRNLAAAKALPVALLDALSLGLTKFVLAPTGIGPAARQLINVPAQTAAQGIAGGLGEGLGQFAQKGKIENWGEIFAEIVGEGASAPMEVLGMRGAIANDRAGRAIAPPRPPTAPEAPPPFSIPPITDAPPLPSDPVAPPNFTIPPAEGREPPPVNPRNVEQFPIPKRARELSPDEVADLGIDSVAFNRQGFSRDLLRADGWKAEIDLAAAAPNVIGDVTRNVSVTAPDGRTFSVQVDTREAGSFERGPATEADLRNLAIGRVQRRLAEGYQPPEPSFPPWLPEPDRAQLIADREREAEAYRKGPIQPPRREAMLPNAEIITPPGAPAPEPQVPRAPPPARPPLTLVSPEPRRRQNLPPDIPAEIFRGSGRADRASAYGGIAFPIMGRGQYFAFDRDTASKFGPNVEAAQIDTQNPLVIRSDEEWRALTRAAGWPFSNPVGRSETEMEALTAKLNQEIRRRGHDAVVVYWNDKEPGDIDSSGRGLKLLRNVFGHPQFFKPATETAAGAPLRTETGRAIPPSESAVARASQTVQRLGANRAKVFTPQGREIEVEYELVDVGSLITSHDDALRPNPRFPAELQPRDRARAASEAQISEIAQRLQPARLGPSASATEGAPIIGGDNVVESGNARVMGLRRAHADFRKKVRAREDVSNHPITRYLDWLKSQGFRLGNVSFPVLVARRRTPLSPDDRVAFTKEANESATLRMGASEQAKADADKVSAILELYKGGDVSLAQNAGFVRAFMNALPASERGALWTEKGGLSQEGVRRIQGALLYTAYEDADLVAKMTESTSNDIKSIAGAMLDVAPAWAQMKDRVAKGQLSPDVDRTKDLMGAVRAVEEARRKGMLVRDVLDQGSLFDERDAKADFAMLFYNDAELKQASGRAAITTRLRKYLEEANKSEAGPNLFGQAPTGAKDILKTARAATPDAPVATQTSLTLRSGFDPTVPAQWYSRQAGRVLDLIQGKVGYRLSPLRNLPLEPEYLAERYRTLGKLANIDAIGHKIFAAFRRATKADRDAVYTYMTTRGASPVGIVNPKVRTDAIEAKALIESVGRKLVAEGLLSQEVLDQHIGEYLPRVYLKHILGKKMRGARVGLNLQYLKERQDIPADIRKFILGEITDPGYLTARGYMVPMRDLVFLDFLDIISQNNEWTLRDSLVNWEGQAVSAAWLWHEAQRIRKQAAHISGTEPGNAERMVTIAIRMEDAARPGLAIEKVEGFTQIPDTPKYGKLRGMWIRTEIFDDLFGNMGFWVEEPSLAERVLGQNGLLSKLTQYWKLGKVALNPGTIVRNTFGNVMLLQLSGVPLARLPDRFVQAVAEIATNGRHWQIAKQYGVTETNFAQHEMARLDRLARSIRSMGGRPSDRLIAILGAIADFAGWFYGRIEALFKVIKIIDAMEREGMTPEKAALEAHKWIFDYSLITKSTRYLRNAPFGIPFVTFTTKVFPRLVEVAAKHPWRVWPYVAMAYMLPAIALSMLGIDEDDYEALKKTLPKHMREKQHGFFLPWKDEKGNFQWVDMSAWAVWNVFGESGEKLAKGDVGAAAYSFGVGGPALQLAASAFGKTDPFTLRQITNPYDPFDKRMTDWLAYVGRVMLPPWIADQGAAEKMWEALNGKLDRRTGELKTTVPQAAARFFGLNIYSIDPVRSRATNIAVMRRELREMQGRFRYVINDKNLSEDDKTRLRAEWNGRLREKAEELAKYSRETERVTQLKK